jgi:hypothetical protein
MVYSVLVIAKNQAPDIEFPILTNFKLEVFREGKLSEKKMLVNLQIWELSDGFYVSWNHVHIEPLANEKRVLLNPRHFSTLEDSIKNVSVNKNGFSFRLEHLKGHGLTADVVGKKREGQTGYSVEASAIDFIFGPDLKKTAETWKSTDKLIVLPYQEVYFGD